ncbi:MAG TPA: hypothetical protein VEY71_05955 [Chitinophagales bacterium]|nr:hypothetical protein [Chitinophagales bacterium]
MDRKGIKGGENGLVDFTKRSAFRYAGEQPAMVEAFGSPEHFQRNGRM